MVTITSEAYSHYKLCPRRWAYYAESSPVVGGKSEDDSAIEMLVDAFHSQTEIYPSVDRVLADHARQMRYTLGGWELVEGILGLSVDQTVPDYAANEMTTVKVVEKLHGIIRSPEGKLYVLKLIPTSSLADVDKRFLLDDESCLQMWLARRHGYAVVGTLYAAFTRDIPQEKYNKSGALSAASARAKDKLRLVCVKEERGEEEVRSSVDRALALGWQHPDDAMQEPTPDYRHVCRDCPFFAQCVAQEKGIPEGAFAWEAVK